MDKDDIKIYLAIQLREYTGRGIMDCKKALYKHGYNFDKAKEYLLSPESNFGKLITIKKYYGN